MVLQWVVPPLRHPLFVSKSDNICVAPRQEWSRKPLFLSKSSTSVSGRSLHLYLPSERSCSTTTWVSLPPDVGKMNGLKWSSWNVAGGQGGEGVGEVGPVI